MKREILYGHGVQGMCVSLSIMDMFAANQVAEELKVVVENHKNREKYNSTPYDQRKTTFPEGEPKRIEVSEKTLQNMHQLMSKLSMGVKSTLFDANDEKEEKESAEGDGNADPANEEFCVQLVSVGQTKLQVLKAIKEFSCISLKEAKDLVDVAEERGNIIVAKDLSFIQATELKIKLLENGATAIILSQSTLQPL